jgi:hypothetical protein
MSKTLTSLFKSYYSQLIKFETVTATKNDLIVIEEAALKSLFSHKVSVVYAMLSMVYVCMHFYEKNIHIFCIRKSPSLAPPMYMEILLILFHIHMY